AVRNTTASPVTATPIVKFLRDGAVHRIKLPPVTLEPLTSQLIDFAALQRAGSLPADFRRGSLEIAESARHPSLVAELFDYDERSGGYPSASSLASYPTRATGSIWRLDGTFRTTLAIENTASVDDQVRLRLFAGDETYEKVVDVPALGLARIDLKELRASGAPDASGHRLTATS